MIEIPKKFSLGFPEMDSQHEYCYRLFDAIKPIGKSGEGVKFAVLLREIEMYLMFHFECEEHLMRMYEFPGFAVHQTDHEIAGNRFIQFQDEFNTGALSPESLYSFLINWLLEHSRTSDIEYVKWIQASRAVKF